MISQTIETNRFRFSALTAGPNDADLVLFLHGFPQFGNSWRAVMRPIAEAGFHTVAVDQRGYSSEARPTDVSDYGVEKLLSDVLGFADSFGRHRFHLVGHDWGAFLAWVCAAKHPDRVQSLTALSTPHPDAFLNAIETDEDQKQRSRYISFFRMPVGVAEKYFQDDNYQNLRNVYQGKLSESVLEQNIRRLSEPGALTAALNWYRALDLNQRIGKIQVPSLYVWSTDDLALGETAALKTAEYVMGPYKFEKLEKTSHWLLEEASSKVSELVLNHLMSNDA